MAWHSVDGTYRFAGDPDFVEELRDAFRFAERSAGPLDVFMGRRRIDPAALEAAWDSFRAGKRFVFAALEWGVGFVGPLVVPGAASACLECVVGRLRRDAPAALPPTPLPAELAPLPGLVAALIALESGRLGARRASSLTGAQLVINPQPDALGLPSPPWSRWEFLPVRDCSTCGSRGREEKPRPFSRRQLLRPGLRG